MTFVSNPVWYHSDRRWDRKHIAVPGREVWTQHATVYDSDHPTHQRKPTRSTYCAICNRPLGLSIGAFYGAIE